MSNAPEWTLSIISHGHGAAIVRQLRSLSQLPVAERAELIVTFNIAEHPEPDLTGWPGVLTLRHNKQPRSFAENHNAAAEGAQGRFFACIDPDLQWRSDPFPALAEALNRPETGLAAPGIVDASGRLADHARELPTPLSVIGRRLGWADDAVPQSARIQDVPWLAGLFLAARRSRWQELGGFDERYRLYAEDVEVCLRCRNAGWRVMRLPEVAAAHHARRESKTNLQRFLWHAAGLARLWFSDTWRQYRQQSQP